MRPLSNEEAAALQGPSLHGPCEMGLDWIRVPEGPLERFTLVTELALHVLLQGVNNELLFGRILRAKARACATTARPKASPRSVREVDSEPACEPMSKACGVDCGTGHAGPTGTVVTTSISAAGVGLGTGASLLQYCWIWGNVM